MVEATSGFRVYTAGAESSRIVAYRLHPDTLAISELSGGGDLFGFPPETWRRPEFWEDCMHPDDRPAAQAFWTAWDRDRVSHELRYRLVTPAGRTIWVHDICDVRMTENGQEIRGVLVDITERVAREAEIGNAMRLRDELLRIVLEELAQPLRAISSYGEMLGRHLSAQEDDVGSDHVVGIRGGVQRLDELLSRLLRVAQGGELKLEELTASLSAIRGKRRHRD